MISYLFRSISEPIRPEMTWLERWRGHDRGLIWNWERGRQLRDERPGLAARAAAGELVQLAWKGGTEALEEKDRGVKYGTLPYLAQWQGLRGEDLNVILDRETTIVCSARNRAVKFRGSIPESE